MNFQDKWASDKIKEINEKLPSFKKSFDDMYEDYTEDDLQLYEDLLEEVGSLAISIDIIKEDNPSFYAENNIDKLYSEIEKFMKLIKKAIKNAEYMKEIKVIRDKLSSNKEEFAKHCKGDYENCYLYTMKKEINDLEDDLHSLRVTQKQMNSSIDLDNVYAELDTDIKSFINDIKDVIKMRKEKMEEEGIQTPTPRPITKTRKARKSRKSRKSRKANLNR
jgi:hypothetical protein